jgi:hypothetical protein
MWRRELKRCFLQVIDKSAIKFAWWHWREGNTWSHSELRSQDSHRRWYYTQECGRVGRRQAFFLSLRTFVVQRCHRSSPYALAPVGAKAFFFTQMELAYNLVITRIWSFILRWLCYNLWHPSGVHRKGDVVSRSSNPFRVATPGYLCSTPSELFLGLYSDNQVDTFR